VAESTYAHDQQVIQRDIKPENMFLGRHNDVLFSDFGLAIISSSSRSQQIQETGGIRAYMAPRTTSGTSISHHPTVTGYFTVDLAVLKEMAQALADLFGLRLPVSLKGLGSF
jgi:serine/threonine protein kinase